MRPGHYWAPRRIERFRRDLAESIPCDPPSDDLRGALRSRSFGELLTIYFEWAHRLVRTAPRLVGTASAFWTPRAEARRTEIEALAGRMFRGGDLLPLLSERVRRHGYFPRGPDEKKPKGIDWNRMDFALNAYGLHHLHLSPKGSEELLFVSFSRSAAVLVMLGDHKSFFDGSVDEAVVNWRAEEDRWTLKGVLPGKDLGSTKRTRLALGGLTTLATVGDKAVVSNFVSTAGTSMMQTMYRDRVAETLRAAEPRLDCEPASVVGSHNAIRLRAAPSWRWSLNCCDLVLVEESTRSGYLMQAGPT